jgi:cell division protein ZapA
VSGQSTEPNFLDVAILGREYRVACPPGEQAALLSAVAYVDGKMQEIAAKSKTAAAERVAVMAALNIAHELLSADTPKAPATTGQTGVDDADFRRRIQVMEAQLDVALKGQEPLF